VQGEGQDLLSRVSATMEQADWDGMVELARRLSHVGRTFVGGAGRSGLVARSFAMRLMQSGLEVYVPGETITRGAEKGDLLVAISCTGQTGTTYYLAQRARELGAEVVVLTAEPDSPLAQSADRIILVPATAENIVLRAAVFEHATSLCLDAVFNVLSKQLKLDVEDFRRHHANLE
jgi:6-phospho-3-hexuloisomerase